MNKKYIFLGTEIEALRASISGNKKNRFRRLEEQCKLYKEQHLTEEHPKGSSTFMAMGATNLSLMFLLTGQDYYLKESKRWLLTGIKYPHWGHAHLVDVDLSASWLLFGYSLSYDWIKDSLTEDEEVVVREKLYLQGKRMYDYAVKTRGEGWSTHFWQNHNWINYTGLAATAYALEDFYPEVKEWREYSAENFKEVYQYMPEDGSDYEGTVYWRYGVPWLYIYAHLIKSEEKKDLFAENKFLKETFFYRLYSSTGSLDKIMNFGDCHDRRSSHSAAVYYKIADEYENGYAQTLGDIVIDKFLFREQYESGIKPGILSEAWLEYIWYNPSVKKKELKELPLVRHWEDLGLVVIKNSWENDSINFSFKCGHPGGKKQWKKSWEIDRERGWKTRGLSHQHPDNNSFIFHGFGSYLTIDDGYNRTVKASDHSIVVVDNQGYIGDGKNDVWTENKQHEVGEIEEFFNQENITYISGETAKTYKRELNLSENRREIIHTGRTHFYVMDTLKSEDNHRYSWLLHSDNHSFEKNEKLVMENGSGTLDIANILPRKKDISRYETYVKAVMTTQEPDKFRETNMKTLSISNSQDSKECKFLNVLNARESFAGDNFSIQSYEKENQFIAEVKNGNNVEKLVLRCESSRDSVIKYREYETDAEAVLEFETDEKIKLFFIKAGFVKKYGQSLYSGERKNLIVKI